MSENVRFAGYLAVIPMALLLVSLWAVAPASANDTDPWLDYPAGAEVASPASSWTRWTNRSPQPKPIYNPSGQAPALGIPRAYLSEPQLVGSTMTFKTTYSLPPRPSDPWHSGSGANASNPALDIRNYNFYMEMQYTCNGTTWYSMGQRAEGWSDFSYGGLVSKWFTFNPAVGTVTGCNNWSLVKQVRYGNRGVAYQDTNKLYPFASAASMAVSTLSYWNPNTPGRIDSPVTSTGQCFSWFGVDYKPWDTVTISGKTYTAEELGCLQQPGEDYYNSFEYLCQGAPEAEWLSFSWVGPWVGHYAKCLFTPNRGFEMDRVTASAEGTALGQVGGLGTAVVNALPRGDSCGKIVDGVFSVGFVKNLDVEIDTCDWVGWGGSLRTIISWVVPVLVGVSILSLVMRALSSRAVTLESGGDDD